MPLIGKYVQSSRALSMMKETKQKRWRFSAVHISVGALNYRIEQYNLRPGLRDHVWTVCA